jgi:hypothetical protein
VESGVKQHKPKSIYIKKKYAEMTAGNDNQA